MLVTSNNLFVILANNQMKLAWVKSLLDFSPSRINGGALFRPLIASVFLPQSPLGIRGFFHQRFFWFYLILYIRLEGFLHQRSTGFPLLSLVGFGDFLSSYKYLLTITRLLELMPKRKAIVTPWSQDLWSCDSTRDLARDLTHDLPTSSLRSKQTLSYQTRNHWLITLVARQASTLLL